MFKYLFVFFCFSPLYVYTQTSLSTDIGNIKNISSERVNEVYITRVDIETENAFVRLLPYSQTVIRVRTDRKILGKDISYAVVQTPDRDGYFRSMKDAGGKWIFRTDSLEMQVQKKPLRITFLTLAGEMISQDESAFGTRWIGEEVTCYKHLFADEKFIGLGEKTGGLNRRGNAYENWNTDDYGYETSADPLYVTTPFYMGIHAQRPYGIFMDNSYKSVFNFGASNDRFSSFGAVAGEMNYYFFGANSVKGILRDYGRLTGFTDMPPLWSLGFQQCRWSYFPDKEVRDLAQTFRDKKIGGDVIYLDINYMDAYKIFTFHPRDFPHPQAMISDLRKLGFHTVVIIDPGIKVEKDYFAYEEGKKQKLFAHYPDSTFYTGQVWPGWCHFPDFTYSATRDWWGNSLKRYTDVGISGFWNDMNEPATWGQSFPDLVEFHYEGAGATHRQVHNIYGMQMARSSYEGAKKHLNGQRPFCLTRAAYSGIQRYAAVWTGDNVATDAHMLAGVRLLNSMGLAGIPFVGCDAGGFSGNTTPDLYARWLSIAAYTPFFRAHSEWNSTAHEPWAWGENTEEKARNIIAQRYQLLPYLYSLFWEAHTQGLPPMRSLAIAYPFDEKIYEEKYENQFLLGENLLIAPTASTQFFQEVYLPAGEWYDLYTDKRYAGNQSVITAAPLDKLPVFVRAGSILPLASARLSTAFPVSDTLHVHVYAGEKSSEFVYYEDDGASFDYEKGKYQLQIFSFSPQEKKLKWTTSNAQYASVYRYYQVIFHGFGENFSLKNLPLTQEKNVYKTVITAKDAGEIMW